MGSVGRDANVAITARRRTPVGLDARPRTPPALAPSKPGSRNLTRSASVGAERTNAACPSDGAVGSGRRRSTPAGSRSPRVFGSTPAPGGSRHSAAGQDPRESAARPRERRAPPGAVRATDREPPALSLSLDRSVAAARPSPASPPSPAQQRLFWECSTRQLIRFRSGSVGDPRRRGAAAASRPVPSPVHGVATWLILPVVICLSQRLSHACLRSSPTARDNPRTAH